MSSLSHCGLLVHSMTDINRSLVSLTMAALVAIYPVLCASEPNQPIVVDERYAVTTEITCGDTLVTVVSACEYSDEHKYAYCFAQKFDFFNASTKQYKRSRIFVNEKYRSNLDVATNIECVKGNRERFINVAFTNFGSGRNCRGCEWAELFDLNGRMLATTRRAGPDYFRLLRKLGITDENSSTVRIERYPQR